MGVFDKIKIRQESFPVIKNKYEFYMQYEDLVIFLENYFIKILKKII